MRNVAAFFDIDGTIYRAGLITAIYKKMIKHELIESNSWHQSIKPAFNSWDKRKGEYDDYLLKLVDAYIETIIGKPSFQIEYIAKRVIEQKGDKVYKFSRNRIDYHKENNHKVFAISGSPNELVCEMARKYGMDDFRGTIYKKDEKDCYTGEIVPMWDSVSKQKSIFDLADKYNIDLDRSYAYGDTMGDFTMLSLVKYPFAINPTQALLKNILQDKDMCQKVTIIVERKDVIYSIKPQELTILEH
ncbi:MAG: haloacid dehalogenase [Epulopiscium sp. Nuni2H_MBin003]|nr:MAG: haloacid dehalogenase [Epulopiscium sp. Nuni2H_MBin003]